MSVKKTNFLTYISTAYNGTGTIVPRNTAFVSLQGDNIKSPSDLLVTYANVVVRDIFEADVSYIPQRVAYSVGSSISSSYLNKLYNNMHFMATTGDMYPIFTGSVSNNNITYSYVVINMLSGGTDTAPTVSQLKFAPDVVYSRNLTLNSDAFSRWDSTENPIAWSTKYWAKYTETEQQNDHNKISTTYNTVSSKSSNWDTAYNTVSKGYSNWDTAYNIVSGNYDNSEYNLWYAKIKMSAVMALTTASTSDEIVTALNMWSRSRHAASARADITTKTDIETVFTKCAMHGFTIIDKTLGPSTAFVTVQSAFNSWILTVVTNKAASVQDSKVVAAPVVYSIQIYGQGSSNQFSIITNPTTHNLYNVNTAYSMAYALTYTQDNYCSMAGWANLASLTSNSASVDIINALNMTDRFGNTVGTSAPLAYNLLLKCSANGNFKMKERVYHGEVKVLRSTYGFILCGISTMIVNGGSTAEFGNMVAYDITLSCTKSNDSYTFAIPTGSGALKRYNLYNA